MKVLLPTAFVEKSNEKSTFRVFYNGDIIRGKRDTDTYVKTLETIGLQRISEECSDIRIDGYDYPPVMTEDPQNTHWQNIDGYRIPTGKRGEGKLEMINLIAEKLHLDLSIDNQYKGRNEQYLIRVILPGSEPIEGRSMDVYNRVIEQIGPRKIYEKEIKYLDFPLIFQAGTKHPERIDCTYGIERDANNKPVLIMQTPGGSDTHICILEKIKREMNITDMVIERMN